MLRFMLSDFNALRLQKFQRQRIDELKPFYIVMSLFLLVQCFNHFLGHIMTGNTISVY